MSKPASAGNARRAREGDRNHLDIASDPEFSTHPQTDPLAEPVIISQFWRNRRGECVRVQLCRYEGRAIVDARVFFTTKTGHMQATGKGLALVVRKLPDLAKALAKATERARELGLLPADEGEA